MPQSRSMTRGFKRASRLLQSPIRKVSEGRGFAVSKVLTQWPEVVGPEIAEIARPVDVSYGGKQGLGATLTVLTTGSQALVVDMQRENIRERVNSVYGYNAIARVKVTQTAATGFSDGKVAFDYGRKANAPQNQISPEKEKTAKALSAPVTDENLRQALERLAQNVLSKTKH